MRNLILITLFSVLCLVSCKAKVEVDSPKLFDLKSVVKSKETLLVDVRSAEDFSKESTPNTINIPLAELDENFDLFKNKRVVVFCKKGKQADQAVDLLNKNSVDVYDGTTFRNIRAIQDEK